MAGILFLTGCKTVTHTKNVQTTEPPAVTGNFDFSVLKAGQADAIIMQTQNHSIIVDCGESDDGDKVVKYLKDNNITNVDYMFITHFDKDHVGGFTEVADNVTFSNIYVPDYEGSNDEYEAYVKTVEEKQLKPTVLNEDMTFIADDVMFEVMVPERKTYAEDDNDFSLVILVTHGENTFLFTGDAEADRIGEVIRRFPHQYDFLKVPHHGKYNKNTKRFINTVKPGYAVICDSEKNPAEKETVSILEHVKSKIYSTKDGNVFVSSDGKEITVSQ